MQTDYLSSIKVRGQLADIAELALQNRQARGSGTVSALDRYFWLSALREDGGVRFQPSCLPVAEGQERYWICNLVLRGGGTLGLAHVGFIAGLEHAGIRFAGLAGASAGAIVALGIAAARGDDLLHGVTDQIVSGTVAAPMDWFIDGPRPIRILIKHMLLHRKIYSPRIWANALRAWRRVLRHRGLNQGDLFERWLETEMEKFDVPRLTDLEMRLARIHDVLAGAEADLAEHFPGMLDDGRRVLVSSVDVTEPQDTAAGLLKLITSAMPIGMKFELPGHIKYLRLDPQRVSPAKLVRMSMAIPVFFDPVRVGVNREEWRASPVLGNLKDLANGEPAKARLDRLDELTFIDGGVFANLPSDSFEGTLPDLPTILVPLESSVHPEHFERGASTASFAKDIVACVQAMRFQRDTDTYLRLRARKKTFEAAHRNETYPRSFSIATAPIATGNADWLNFVMDDADKRRLFLNGVTAAGNFLKGISDDTGAYTDGSEFRRADGPRHDRGCTGPDARGEEAA